jgi:hypothetical protein
MKNKKLISISLLFISILVGQFAIAAAQMSKSNRRFTPTKLSPPQVLEVGDSLIGFRVGQGSAFDGASVIGGNYEYMFRQNFGIGGQLHYSNYNSAYGFGPYHGEWTYSAWTVLGYGSFHPDIFKVSNLDTFVTGGIAHTFISARWSSNMSFPEPNNADSGSTYLVAYLNARYFFDPQWSVIASIGTGLGTLGLGMDYLF